MKYIDSEKLIDEIERQKQENETSDDKEYAQYELDVACGYDMACEEILSIIASLQQEQPCDMKSPFTGGNVVICSREEEVTFRGEKIKIVNQYYRCVDTGREFTDSKLDEDMMWSAFRAYCEKKGMTSFTDIMLKQEQPEVDLEKVVEFEYVGKKVKMTIQELINYYIAVMLLKRVQSHDPTISDRYEAIKR